MGIKGAWEVFKHAQNRLAFMDLCLQEGHFDDFANPHPEYVLGIDATLALTRALAPTLKQQRAPRDRWANIGRPKNLETSLHQLGRYLNSPSTVVFVFDGPSKPSRKRDTAVVTRQTKITKSYQQLIQAMGFDIYEAAGEADADLGKMSRFGLLNSVLSDDSDVFLFGGKTVIRIPNVKQDGDYIDIYRAVDIRRHEANGLDYAQLILFALLVGNDYDPAGLRGCGPRYALLLARSDLATQLLAVLQAHSSGELNDGLEKWRRRLRDELAHNTSNLLPHTLPIIAQDMSPSFPDMTVARLLAYPNTSDLSVLRLAACNWQVRMPNVGRLAYLCADYFKWDLKTIISKFQKSVFPGLCMRYLIQVISLPRHYQYESFISLQELDISHQINSTDPEHAQRYLRNLDWKLVDASTLISSAPGSFLEVDVNMSAIYEEISSCFPANADNAIDNCTYRVSLPSILLRRSGVFQGS